MNLFDAIDSAFRGVVMFVYNFLYTSFLLVRHPRRSPTFLARRYLGEASRQMSSQSYLVVLLSVTLFSGMAASPVAHKDVLASSSLNITSWLPYIIAAIITVATADAILRVMFWSRGSRGRALDFRVVRTLFLFAWPAITFFAAMLALGLLPYSVTNRGWFNYAVAAAVLVSSMLPARHVVVTEFAIRRRRRLMMAGAFAATSLLMIVQYKLLIESWRFIQQPEEREAFEASAAEVTHAKCVRTPAGLDVEFAVKNGTAEPVVVDLETVSVTLHGVVGGSRFEEDPAERASKESIEADAISGGRSDASFTLALSSGTGGRLALIQPGQAELFAGSVPGLDPALLDRAECAIGTGFNGPNGSIWRTNEAVAVETSPELADP